MTNPTEASPHIGAADLASLAATFHNVLLDQLHGPNASNAAMQLTGTYIQALVQLAIARQRIGPTSAQMAADFVAHALKKKMGGGE
jgi:hypothetical protein